MVEPLNSLGRSATLRSGKTPTPSKTQAEEAPKTPASGDRLLLASAPATSKARPTPIAPEGNLDYYQKRHLDFQARYPDQAPPSYYLGYGDVYVRRFTEVLSPELSRQGQDWLVQARKNLQAAIEDELARNPAIELDDEAFTAFAYDTHSRAYLDAGLTSLPVDDLIRVAVTPNLSDTLNAKGIKVISETAAIVAEDKLAKAMDAPDELAAEVLNAIKTSPDLLQDVLTLLDTAENAKTLREGLMKLKGLPGDSAKSLVQGFWDLTTRKLKEALDAFEAFRPRQSREPASA